MLDSGSMEVGEEKNQLLSKPKFERLMDIYAEIYRQVTLLFDDTILEHDRLISRVPGELPIYLEITERHRYTTFARLTYFLEDGVGRITADPDAHLRIYHDAQMAEATHCYPGTVSQPLVGSKVPVADVVNHRWRSNCFMDRWLEYLLRQGHGLETIRPARQSEWPTVSVPVEIDLEAMSKSGLPD